MKGNFLLPPIRSARGGVRWCTVWGGWVFMPRSRGQKVISRSCQCIHWLQTWHQLHPIQPFCSLPAESSSRIKGLEAQLTQSQEELKLKTSRLREAEVYFCLETEGRRTCKLDNFHFFLLNLKPWIFHFFFSISSIFFHFFPHFFPLIRIPDILKLQTKLFEANFFWFLHHEIWVWAAGQMNRAAMQVFAVLFLLCHFFWQPKKCVPK